MHPIQNRRWAAIIAIAGICLIPAIPFGAAAEPFPPRDSTADALAGHQAEQLQFGAAADPLRRTLFFDPVYIESVPAGVPCNHLARRRPDRVAGDGFVVLLRAGDDPVLSIRYWAAPGDAFSDEEAIAKARRFAAGHTQHIPAEIIGVRRFAWCK